MLSRKYEASATMTLQVTRHSCMACAHVPDGELAPPTPTPAARANSEAKRGRSAARNGTRWSADPPVADGVGSTTYNLFIASELSASRLRLVKSRA